MVTADKGTRYLMVSVYSGDELIHWEICESEGKAARVAAIWEGDGIVRVTAMDLANLARSQRKSLTNHPGLASRHTHQPNCAPEPTA